MGGRRSSRAHPPWPTGGRTTLSSCEHGRDPCAVRARGLVALLAATLSCLGAAPPVREALVSLPASSSTNDAFLHLPGQLGATGVVVLEDNAAAWAVRWQLLRQAQKSIDIGTFIFDGDHFGRALLGALVLGARQGVRTRLLIDGRGSLALSTPFLGRDDLAAVVRDGDGRIDVRVFNPPWNEALGALVTLDATRLSAGTHNKLFIVDEAAAVVGGRNVTEHSFVALREDAAAVVDADVLLDGPVIVKALDAVFVAEFERARHESVGGAWWGGRARADELALLALAMDAWTQGRVPLGEEIERRTGESRSFAAVLDERVEALWKDARRHAGPGTVRAPSARLRADLIALAKTRSIWGCLATASPFPPVRAWAKVMATPSRPRAASHNPAADALLRAIAGAQRSIVFETPSFVLGPSLLLALQAASERGVDILVLTNGPRSSDSPFAQSLFIDSWPELMARVPRLRLLVARERQMQHGKRAVFDDALSCTGTFNLDPFSTQMNSETLVCMWSTTLASSIRATLARRTAQMDEYLIARHPSGVVQRHPSGTAQAGNVVVVFGPQQQVGEVEIARLRRTKTFLLAVQPLFDFDVLVW
jgi:putative cardiolipin synthase